MGILNPRLKVNVFLVSSVPVPHFVKFKIAHVISSYFTNLLAILFDVAPKIVLRPHLVSTEVKSGDYAVFVISELELASVLVTHGSHENVPEVVADPTVFDLLPIFEVHCPRANAVDRRRVRIRFYVERKVPIASVVHVGTFNDVIRSWRMMTRLLEYD